MIDNDLKSKTRVYSWRMAPLVFDNKEQMQKWFNNPKNAAGVRFYETIILRDEVESEYVWDGEQLIPCEKKVYDSTFTSALEEKDILNYELAFYVNERKVVSTCFEGVYPYYIRRNIDLSNTRGKFEGEDLSKLNFESYLLNRLVNDKQDLIKTIVKELCTVCSYQDNEDYTLFESFRKSNNVTVTYNLNFNDPKIINATYAKEIAKAKRYLYGNNYNKSK
jgi:hypothetical protein